MKLPSCTQTVPCHNVHSLIPVLADFLLLFWWLPQNWNFSPKVPYCHPANLSPPSRPSPHPPHTLCVVHTVKETHPSSTPNITHYGSTLPPPCESVMPDGITEAFNSGLQGGLSLIWNLHSVSQQLFSARVFSETVVEDERAMCQSNLLCSLCP